MPELPDASRSPRHALPPEVARPLARVCALVVSAGLLLILSLMVRHGGRAVLAEWPIALVLASVLLLPVAVIVRRLPPHMLGFLTAGSVTLTGLVGLGYIGFGPGLAVWLTFIAAHAGVLVGARALLGTLAGTAIVLVLAAIGWERGVLPVSDVLIGFRNVPDDPIRWTGAIVATMSGCAASSAVSYFLKRALLDHVRRQQVDAATLAHEQQLRAQAEVERLGAEAEAARAARQSAEQMRAVFRAAPVAANLARDRRFIETNDEMVRLFGYSREEVVGGTAEKFYRSREEYEKTSAAIYAGLNRDGYWEGELILAHKSGAPIDVLLKVTHLDQSRPEDGIVSMVLDLRERKRIEALHIEQARIEARSRESIEQLREIFEHTTEIIFVVRVEPDGRFIYERINAACRTIGLNPDDFNAGTRTPEDIFGAEAAAIFSDAYRRCLESRAPLQVEQTVPTPRGLRIFSTLLVPVTGVAEADVVRLLGFARDQTERIQASLALAQSEAKYRGMFENAVVGLFSIAPDEEIFSINGALAQMYGYASPEAMLGEVHDLGSQIYADPAQRVTVRAELAARGRVDNVELQVRRRDGSLMWVLMSAHVVTDPSAGRQYIEGSCIDITERKQAIELRQAKAEAEAASRAKSTFLATMSHEIRTPMNAILGFAQLMLRDRHTTAGQREHLAIIERNGAHLLALINDILEMSKIEAHRIVLQPVAFDLRLLARDLELMFTDRARARGLAFAVSVPAHLPEAVTGDESRLRQILVNLVANAVKFTARGHVHVRLELPAATPSGWRLRAQIEDTGPGIPAADLPRLFRQFEQAAAGRAAGGTGLGLAISRELARLMEGDITVTSRPGQGSTFILEVPLGYAEGPVALQRSTPGGMTRRLAPGQPVPRVLVVDDIEDNRRLLDELLASVGFEVRDACDGAQAVEVFQDWQPHAILMDLRMPVMDGNEATMRIRALPRGRAVRIMSLSASAFSENREQMLAAGADDFLAKPFSDEVLLERLGRLLDVTFESTPITIAGAGSAPGPTPGAEKHPLPTHLVTALRQTLDAADLDHALELIDLVATHDADLARSLRKHIASFDYDRALAQLAHAPTYSEST